MAQLTVASLEQAGIVPPQDATGAAQKIPATSESGYYSAVAAAAVEQLGFDPSMAIERQRHHAPEAEIPDLLATAQERMAAKVRTPEGRAVYARRKVIVEPVFGQIKAGRGFRRFLLRGLDNIRGEWRLVCVTHTLLKIWRYACAPLPANPEEMVPYVPAMPLFRASYHLRTDRFSLQSRWRQQVYQSRHPNRRTGLGSKGYMR
jgi:hypothetical protein